MAKQTLHGHVETHHAESLFRNATNSYNMSGDAEAGRDTNIIAVLNRIAVPNGCFEKVD